MRSRILAVMLGVSVSMPSLAVAPWDFKRQERVQNLCNEQLPTLAYQIAKAKDQGHSFKTIRSSILRSMEGESKRMKGYVLQLSLAYYHMEGNPIEVAKKAINSCWAKHSEGEA